VSRHIEILASDAFEGRGPGTPGETKSIDYIAGQFRSAGLQPGGDLKDGKRSWTQDVPLLCASIDGAPSISVASGGVTTPLTQGEQIVVRAALTGQNHVTLKDVPMIFVGYGVTALERNWDDYKGINVRGKLLVMLVNDPDFEPGAGDLGGRSMTYYGRHTYKYEEAMRRGAVGVLIVHEGGRASQWAVVKHTLGNQQCEITAKATAASHTPFESWIQHDVAVKLFADSGLDFEPLKKAAQTRTFQPVPLKATLSADYAVNASITLSHNVVARIAGKRHPDETLIYAAHWDHLGIGEPDAKGDRIYHGAVDDGSGTAMLIELARAFKAAPQPDRSVVFIAFTGEEKLFLGSAHYVAAPLYPLATTVGMLNMDFLAPSGPAKNFDVTGGNAKVALLDDLVDEGKKQGLYFTPHPDPTGFYYRVDIVSFAKAGVPAITVEVGNDLVDGGVARGDAEAEAYSRDRYHTPADRWEPNWNTRGELQAGELLFAVGERLANSREWPNWSAESEFRTLRDVTAAERK
jgi:Zn-dependent M28 family amino/carboxypeptidase